MAGIPKLSNKIWAIFSLFERGLRIGSDINIGCSFFSSEFIPNFENIWLNIVSISCSFSKIPWFTW